MRFIKNVLVYLLIAALTVTCIPPMEAAAASDNDIDAAIEAAIEAERQANDGIQGRLEGNVPDEFYGTPAKSRAVTHDPKFDGWTRRDGIDVSHHQGVIDWDKVAADGIEFAFIRVAGRGYGTAGNLFEDALYKTNLKEARVAGLDVGVYIYSQAITQKEAKDEAAYILERIKGYDVNLPVVFDYEYYAGGRLSNAKLTDKQRTDICRAFCEAVEFAGYEPMIYANKSMLKNDLDAASLAEDYQIWLAHYTTATDYQGTYTYWQYTSSGSVDGISGNVDRNYHYVEPGFRINETTENAVTMEWTPIAEAEGYVIYRKVADASYEIIAQIDDPAVTTYTDTGLTGNTMYSYYVRYYKIDENGQQTIYKSGYPAKKTMTPLKLEKVVVSGEALDAGTVKLTWEKEPDATGYIVQQYDFSKKKYVKVATVLSEEAAAETTESEGAAEDSALEEGDAALEEGDAAVEEEESAEPVLVEYTKSDLIAGTTYKFRVRALADIGGATVYGSFSTPVELTTASKLVKPVLTAKPYSYTTNKLSWTKVPGATAYQIQKYNSSKKKWVLLKTVTGTSTSNTYLNCNTTYKYRVRAIAKTDVKTINSYYSVAQKAKTKGSRKAVVKNGPLNVRKGAGTKYGKLTTVKKNANLTVTGSTKSWYKIKIKVKGKYKTGYVLKKYVRLK